MKESGLMIEAVYSDPDLVEVVVSASNRWFAGASTFYSGEEELRAAAATLKGFPSNTKDTRVVRLGESTLESRGGHVVLRFFCRDGSGHITVEAKLSAGDDYGETPQDATVAVSTEAAAVDTFIKELAAMAATGKGTAHLRIAGARPMEDRAGRDGSRIALGQTEAGRYLRVIYVPDPTPGSVFVITAYDLGEKARKALRRRQKSSKRKKP
jgi:hypothetical protein